MSGDVRFYDRVGLEILETESVLEIWNQFKDTVHEERLLTKMYLKKGSLTAMKWTRLRPSTGCYQSMFNVYLMMLVTLTLLTIPLFCTISLVKEPPAEPSKTGDIVVSGAGFPVTVQVRIAVPPTTTVVLSGPEVIFAENISFSSERSLSSIMGFSGNSKSLTRSWRINSMLSQLDTGSC